MKKTFLSLLLLLLCTGCGSTRAAQTAFFAMDTYMTIQAYGKNAEKAMEQAEQAVFSLENKISRTRENTDLARLNAADGETVSLSPEAYSILEQGKALTVPGVFDLTIAAVSDLWGINTDSSRIPSQEEIDIAKNTVSSENLVLLENSQARLLNHAKVDPGAIGKGFAADQCVEILRENGVKSALISLGGNIYALGEKPDGSAWTVGIADPDGEVSYLATLSVRDTSIVTTGDYERYFIKDGVRYHHVFDPSTGAPARSGLRSVTVVHPNSTLADARSTTLFVLGLEKGLEYCTENQLEAVFITDQKEIYLTDGLRDCFTFLGEAEGYAMGS